MTTSNSDFLNGYERVLDMLIAMHFGLIARSLSPGPHVKSIHDAYEYQHLVHIYDVLVLVLGTYWIQKREIVL